MQKILSIGQACVDLVVSGFSRMPHKGELIRVPSITMTTGGCANNAAKALGKLGADVSLCTLLGEDDFADVVRRKAQESHVDLRFVKTTREAGTGSTVVLLHEDAERSFLNDQGTNAVFNVEDIPFDAFSDFSIALISGVPLLASFYGEGCRQALQHLQAAGITTALDLAFDSTGSWQEKVLPCLPFCDYFMPSDLEAQAVSGKTDENDMADFFLGKGAAHVLIKLGSRGCLYADAKTRFLTPSIPVNPVDTTGAGDCFCAGFLYGLANHYSLEDSVLLGNASGALCVSHTGATEGMQSALDIRKWLIQKGFPLSVDQ